MEHALKSGAGRADAMSALEAVLEVRGSLRRLHLEAPIRIPPPHRRRAWLISLFCVAASIEPVCVQPELERAATIRRR